MVKLRGTAAAICFTVLCAANAFAQEALVDELLRENAALKAKIAQLESGDRGQCAKSNEVGNHVTLLMQKLAQIKDDAAIAALGPPASPIVLPDSVLSALVPNQFILTLSGATADLANPSQLADAFGLQEAQIRYVYTRVLQGFSADITPEQAARLADDPRIAGVTQDGFVFPAQLGNAQAAALADAVQVNQMPPSDETVDVYVFDSGIRASHASLNGLVGAGFTSFRNGIGTEDCNGHGTHVAGLVGGRQFGQTSQARLISVKVLDRDSYGDVSTLIAGVEWVLAQPGPRKIANMSLTRLDPAPVGEALIDRAVQALLNADIPVVVAAGNSASDARLYSPARLTDAITVGAMDGEQLAATSNSGEGVDFYIQGANRASASLANLCGYERMTGTSMATAQVTGLAVEAMLAGADAATLAAKLRNEATVQNTDNFAGEVQRFILIPRVASDENLCDGAAYEVTPTPPQSDAVTSPPN